MYHIHNLLKGEHPSDLYSLERHWFIHAFFLWAHTSQEEHPLMEQSPNQNGVLFHMVLKAPALFHSFKTKNKKNPNNSTRDKLNSPWLPFSSFPLLQAFLPVKKNSSPRLQSSFLVGRKPDHPHSIKTFVNMHEILWPSFTGNHAGN